MKRLTIVTWCEYNYGTYFQAYALCRVLAENGYKVSLISEFPTNYSLKTGLIHILRHVGILKIIMASKGIKMPVHESRGRKFVDRFIPKKELWRSNQLRKIVSNTDVFITGSDQIWNTFHHYQPEYFLSFAEDRKRIAYSSSIGTMKINPEYESEMRNLLSCFSHISMREASGAKAVSELLGGIDVTVVSDPVFFLSAKDWKQISRSVPYFDEKEPYLLVYCVGANDKYKKQVSQIAEKLGISRIVCVPSFEHQNFWVDSNEIEVVHGVGPQEFLWLMDNAAYICTDSFHATALSLIFNKNFTELTRFNLKDPESQNVRLLDLLRTYDLKNRFYDESGGICDISSIDYAIVNKKVLGDKNRALRWLLNSIES